MPAESLGHEIRRLGSQTLVYGLGGVALQLAGVVTLPIFARHFAPADYGVLELGMVTASALMIVVDAGMASASQRSYFDHGDDEEATRRRILVTALTTQLLVGGILAVVIALAAGPISRALFDGRDQSAVVVLIAVSLPAFAVAQFAREVMRLEHRAWAYLASSVAGAAVGTTISVLAVVAWHEGVKGPFIGTLVGWGVGAAYGLVLVGRRLIARFSRRELETMLRFGIPLIPTAFALWALSLVDREMLAHLADLDAVGQYAVANRIATPVLMLVTALALALSPYIFSIYQVDPEREKHVRARVLTDFTAALMGVGLVTALWAREIGELVAPGYDDAFRSVGILTAAFVAYGISSVVVTGISIARQTKWLTLYSGIAAVANIGLNFIVIPPFGQVGAAVATLVAYALLAGLYYRRSQILYPTPYRPGPVLATLACGLALTPLGAIAYADAATAWTVKVAAVAAYLIALRVIGVVRRP